jgi:hypothetical protein
MAAAGRMPMTVDCAFSALDEPDLHTRPIRSTNEANMPKWNKRYGVS